jgi:hypothetical protein
VSKSIEVLALANKFKALKFYSTNLLFGLGNGVVVTVNDAVQVACDNLGNLHKLVKVKATVGLESLRGDQLGKRDTGQVANRRFIGSCVFHDFTAQIRRLDGSQVLLIGLAVGMVLEQHVGGTRFHLCIKDGEPQLLSLDGLTSLAFPFVTLVELDEFITKAVG